MSQLTFEFSEFDMDYFTEIYGSTPEEAIKNHAEDQDYENPCYGMIKNKEGTCDLYYIDVLHKYKVTKVQLDHVVISPK